MRSAKVPRIKSTQKEYIMKKIDKISDEKFAEIAPFRETCYKLGTATDPVDRPRLEEAYKKLYKILLDKTPDSYIWVDSPKAAKEIFLSNGIKDAIHSNCFWGGIELYWVGYIQFMAGIPGIEVDPKKAELLDIYSETMYGHMWWPRDNCVIACERPSEIHTDRFRLSNLTGPAVSYRDGFGVYFVDGVAVDGKFVRDPSILTIDTLKGERNAETRRALMKLYGTARYLKDVGASLLDSKPQQKLFQEPDGEKFLICTDGSTGRIYELAVAATVTNCDQAQETLIGLPITSVVMGS
jgi:hypothetical protein